VQGDTPRNADELRRRKRLFECVFSIHRGPPTLTWYRVLEEIKDKLQLLSERPGAADYVENEGDVTAACDLADDLRDAIVEYQVSTKIRRRKQSGSFKTGFLVCSAEGDLRAKLWINCESRAPHFKKAPDFNRRLKDTGQTWFRP